MRIKQNLIYIISFFLLMSFSCGSKNNENSGRTTTSGDVPKPARKFDSIHSQPPAIKEDIAVVNTYPHDHEAFTQGLVYLEGYFIESTGQYGSSSLRKVEVETGKVVKKLDVSGRYFAEGLTVFGNKIYQLTWVSNVCFVYDLNTFKQLKTFTYTGEGWGLTHDGKNLIMSDGSNMLRYLNPDNFQVISTVAVTDENGMPVNNLNELEYINGEVWANIWQTDRIARINPITGKVNSFLNISLLWDYIQGYKNVDVLNGIAYDKSKDRIFLTGKYWPLVFEVKLNK